MLVALRSRRQIAPFNLHRPATLAEAVSLRSAPGTNVFLAGGIDLIDWLKHGHPIDRLIRLDGLPGLSDISGNRERLAIGAMATHAAIVDSTLIRILLPDLAMLWQGVANPRVRFSGTIGGNVMAGRAEYDALPALLALGAAAEIETAEGLQHVALDHLAVLDQPLLTGFTISTPAKLRLFADRSLRPAITVWLGLTVIEGRVTTLRLAVGMAHPMPVCIAVPLDVPLASVAAAAANIAADAIRLLPAPISDGRASAAYRRRMVEVLARRILVTAGETP